MSKTLVSKPEVGGLQVRHLQLTSHLHLELEIIIRNNWTWSPEDTLR